MDIINVDEWFEIRDLRNEIAHDYEESDEISIDIIVHTQKMYQKLKDLNSSFYRDSILKGQILC
jgi:uncharacterized protein with HEPN domain